MTDRSNWPVRRRGLHEPQEPADLTPADPAGLAIWVAAGERARRLAGPAVRAFFRLADHWQLTNEEQLSVLGESISLGTVHTWRTAGPPETLSADVLERISHLLGIYEGLERVFRQAPGEGERWLSRAIAEPPFGGRTPRDLMIAGEMAGLEDVRAYVYGIAGGPPSRISLSPAAFERMVDAAERAPAPSDELRALLASRLPPELQAYGDAIYAKMQTAESRNAVRRLREASVEEINETLRAALTCQVDEGIADAEAGRVVDGDAAFKLLRDELKGGR